MVASMAADTAEVITNRPRLRSDSPAFRSLHSANALRTKRQVRLAPLRSDETETVETDYAPSICLTPAPRWPSARSFAGVIETRPSRTH